jgi:hypothetical protein
MGDITDVLYREEYFRVTEDHLKLIQRMYVKWDDGAYEGAPAIGIKRPYGNSDVLGDIAEILDWELTHTEPGWDGYVLSPEQAMAARDLHKQTAVALQIALVTQSFRAGLYCRPARWTIDWEYVGE